MKKNNNTAISVIIIAKDEEKNIIGCLKSVNWADEIIVVDDGSTDKTAEIATRNGARIINSGGVRWSGARNLGLKSAKSEWILYVDADERVSKELRDEIKQIINNGDTTYSYFAIPRKNIILGKELKHGWWPDYVKRLYKKEFLKKWVGEIHEEPQLTKLAKNKIGHLENPLIHNKHSNLSEMLEKTNKWSEIEAKLMFEVGHPKMNVPRFLSAMFREFWLRMIKQRAFLDGSTGIIYAQYQVISKFISYAKLWEKQIQK